MRPRESPAGPTESMAEVVRDLLRRMEELEADNRTLRAQLEARNGPLPVSGAGQVHPDPPSEGPVGNHPGPTVCESPDPSVVSRRRVLIGSAGTLAAGTAAVLATGSPAAATDYYPLLVSQSNSATYATTLVSDGGSALTLTANYGAGLRSTGVEGGVIGTGPASAAGVLGTSTTGTGVAGTTGTAGTYNSSILATITPAGVVGSSGNHPGVTGASQMHPGVAGLSTDDAGVYGVSTNGAGVSGSGTAGVTGSGSDVGLSGDSSNGTGVKGYSETGSGVVGTSLGKSTFNAFAGVVGQATNRYGVAGLSNGGAGVRAASGTAAGIAASSTSGPGGQFTGGRCAINLTPTAKSGRPSTGSHIRGDLVVDAQGALYLCSTSGTPGTWVRVVTTSA